MPEHSDATVDTAMMLIDKLQKSKASKKATIVLTISIVLDLALSAGFFTNQVNNHGAQIKQCEQNNAARAQDKDLWEFIINASGGTQKTVQQKAEIRILQQKINAKDTPRDCNNIYGFYIWSHL